MSVSKASEVPGQRRPLYQPFEPIIFRMPLLPIESYRELSTPCGGASGRGGSAPLHNDAVARILAEKSEAALAILIASPSLYTAWKAASKRGELDRRVRGKLLRYLIRMSTRATPYGMFAGVALASLSGQTDITVKYPPRKHIRPDMGWLTRLIEGVESSLESYEGIRLVTNPAARIRAGRLVLCDHVPRKEGLPPAEISLRATPLIQHTMKLTRYPVEAEELMVALRQWRGATEEKVNKLVRNLCEQGFLLTDIHPGLSPDCSREMLTRLAQVAPTDGRTRLLSDTLHDCGIWEALSPEESIPRYMELYNKAKKADPSSKDPPFQIDMTWPSSPSNLGHKLAEEVARAATILLEMSPFPHGPPSVISYRNAFLARYNDGQEVPLLELLDPEVGLGPSRLLPPSNSSPTSVATSRSNLLLEVASHHMRTGDRLFELQDDALNALRTCSVTAENVPRSLDVLCQVSADSLSALNRGEFQVIINQNAGVQGAGRSFGRFAYLFDELGRDALRRLADSEDSLTPGTITATLVYPPRRSRSANVTLLPTIRRHEIHFGCPRPSPGITIIPLSELLVGVRDGRFYLRWAANGQEVRVAGGHMLNLHQAPELCKFLLEISQDGIVQFSPFGWGPAEGLSYLPRVQCGRSVLRPAEWKITGDARRHMSSPSMDQSRRALHSWRETWNVPRHVFLCQADNRLLLDLDSADQAEELLKEVSAGHSSARVILQESIIDPSQQWLAAGRGHYLAEFAFPLVLRKPVPHPQSHPPTPASLISVRTPDAYTGSPTRESSTRSTGDIPEILMPGSECLFLKLYCGRNLQNDILSGPLLELYERVIAPAGRRYHFFFLRYTDPEHHLRVRFLGPPEDILSTLLPIVLPWATKLARDGLVRHFSIDTYKREIARYGGAEGLLLAERFFCIDSASILGYMQALKSPDISLALEDLAVVTTDAMLAALGLAVGERLAWLHSYVKWNPEYGDDYRKRKIGLRELLAHNYRKVLSAQLTPFLDVFDSISTALSGVGDKLRSLEQSGKLGRSLQDFYAAFCHLHCNRLLGIDADAERRVLSMLLRTHASYSRFN